MPNSPARSDITCRNCGVQAPLNFCAVCGQETALHPPTLGEFLKEFFSHYVALEGALWRTLRSLLLQPGRLTREYLAGRRRQYVLPLRLYLTASFVFFLVLKLLPLEISQAVVLSAPVNPEATAADPGAPAASSAAAPSAQERPAPVSEVMHRAGCGTAGEPACEALEGLINRASERVKGDPLGTVKHMRERLMSSAPYAVFLLLPVFAGIIGLVYQQRRDLTYGEHVVFSLHLHAFWFLALLLMALLPKAVSDWVLWVVPLYGTWAMHEVYRGHWARTLLRAAFVSLVYGGVLLLATVGLTLGLLATG